MFKKTIALLLLICICTPLFASIDLSKAEPYQDGEFPKWALDIRRSEIIFLGSLPVSFIAAGAFANDSLGFTKTILIAAGVSAAITLADIIIGLFEE